jgi:RNA polymerase sigma-70 factor (ECF subfamily)
MEMAMSLNDVQAVMYVTPQHDQSIGHEHLVSAAQAGSSAAFEALCEIYSQRIYRRLLNITKNREDAQDALQDTFLRAYLALHGFEGRSSFYSWLTRIAINSALMVLRKRHARAEVSFDCPNETEERTTAFDVKDKGPSPEQICDHHQRCARVMTSMGKLRPHLRQMLEMQLSQNYSIREIAQAFGVSEAAVKSSLSRARARLRRANR